MDMINFGGIIRLDFSNSCSNNIKKKLTINLTVEKHDRFFSNGVP